MGIIIKQGSKNAIYTYLGFLIGAIYTAILIPKVFMEHPEYWGAARLLTSYAFILAPWIMLGSPMAIIKFFPEFRNKSLGKFLFAITFWVGIGIIIASIGLFLFSRWWFQGTENNVFTDNYYLIYPLLIGYILFEVSSAIAKSLYKSVITVALKEFFLRLIILSIILLFWFNIITFVTFLYIYSFAYLIVFIPLFISLLKNKEVTLLPDFHFLLSKNMNRVYVYALFTILSTGAAVFLTQIDTLMISEYLDLKDVAIYGPSMFIATAIVVPSRSIMAIVNPMVSNAWATDSIDTIKNLYKKTSIAPLTITIFLFLVIWVNIDLIMHYYGKDFGQGKYIVLFISLGNIINISTGINGTIINTSKYYKSDIIFQIILVVLTVITNILLIPKYGINGAALATGITILVYNLIKLGYVYFVLKIHPFSVKTLIVGVIGVIFFIGINNITKPDLLLYSILYTIIISILYPFIIYKLHVSSDINSIIDSILLKLRINK
jgi:O-antigen/teichoic acid export membrane protein